MLRNFGLTVAVSLVCAVPAAATTLIPASLEEVASAADVVVRGQVVGAEGRLDRERGMVFTHVRIRTTEVLRGEVPEGIVEVVTPGGVDEAAAAWSRVRAAPDPGSPGQEIVVFLYGDRGERYSNVVFWQGLYHVDEGLVRETREPVGVFLQRVRELLPERPSEAARKELGR